MPLHPLEPGASLHYELDDYLPPWRESPAETVLFLHGFAESGLAWSEWVPPFAKHYRLVRPDMRGFGRSTPMPRDHAWTMDELVGDFISLMDALDTKRFHIVAAKIAGIPALAMAAAHPDRVRSLSLFATPAVGATMVKEGPPTALFESRGIAGWARDTMDARGGTAMSPEAKEWWIAYMGRTPLSTGIGFMEKIGGMDASVGIERVRCPTLLVNSTNGRVPNDELRPWLARIPDGRMIEYESDAHHLAVTHARVFAPEVLAFIGGIG